MRWSEFANAQPELAALGQRKLLDPGVVLVATIRRDGSPRLSAVEPYLLDGELWLSMLLESRKAKDLLRDPRVLVHSVVTGRDGADGEFKLRGTARPHTEPDLQRRYAASVAESLGWRPVPGRFHLFAIDIDDISFVRYDDPTGDQFVARWPRGGEYVRRATSATSLGEPEPCHELLRQ